MHNKINSTIKNSFSSLFTFQWQHQGTRRKSGCQVSPPSGPTNEESSVRINHTVTSRDHVWILLGQPCWSRDYRCLGELHRDPLQKKKNRSEKKIAVLTNEAAASHIQRNSTGWNTIIHHFHQSFCFYDPGEKWGVGVPEGGALITVVGYLVIDYSVKKSSKVTKSAHTHAHIRRNARIDTFATGFLCGFQLVHMSCVITQRLICRFSAMFVGVRQWCVLPPRLSISTT